MIEGFKFFSGTQAIRGKRPADRQHYTSVTVALVRHAGHAATTVDSDSGSVHSRRGGPTHGDFQDEHRVAPRLRHQRNPSARPNQNLSELRGKNLPTAGSFFSYVGSRLLEQC